MRVFFDTNVLLSALHWPGLPGELFETVAAAHEAVTGEPVLEELNRKLRDKFHATPAQQAAALALTRQCLVAPTPAVFPAILLRDPNDLPILACALVAGADGSVTGDRDFLGLSGKVEVEFLSPRELWERLHHSTQT